MKETELIKVDEKHREKIEREAIDSLCRKGFDRGAAISFVNEVSEGNVKHVKIVY